MQTFKNGPLLKILYFLILGFSLLVSLCSTFKSFSFSTFFNDPFYYINGESVEPLTTEPVQISLPYPDYSNRQIYKKMLRTIILANPEIKLTKLDSKYFGKVREEDMDFEDFI